MSPMIVMDIPNSRVLAATVVVVLVAGVPAAARDVPRRPPSVERIVARSRPPAAPLGIAISPGVVLATPFTLVAGHPDKVVRVPHYIGPDGTYEDYADLVRSIDGTPCGEECTRRSLRRWGYAPAY